MEYHLTIPGKFPSMNQFIGASGKSVHAGNNMKRSSQREIAVYIMNSLRGKKIKTPIMISYTYYEQNKRRDLDNISGYFHKVFQDALVECGIIKNDSWGEICGFSDTFGVDKDNPRIEIVLKEV